jgi:hypothetical protein
MKTVCFILLIFFLSSCTSYKLVTAPKVNEFIDVQGTKDELYIKANQWIVRTFKDAKSVIQFQDKAEGKIMGKYLMHSTTYGGGFGLYSTAISSVDVYSLITISVKDNATKIDIEPMGEWKYDSSGVTIFNYSPEKAQRDINTLIQDYKKFILLKEDVWQKSESTNSTIKK